MENHLACIFSVGDTVASEGQRTPTPSIFYQVKLMMLGSCMAIDSLPTISYPYSFIKLKRSKKVLVPYSIVYGSTRQAVGKLPAAIYLRGIIASLPPADTTTARHTSKEIQADAAAR